MAARDVFGIVGTTQAGNFHVERVVAEGGFGVVYRAQHGGFRAPVAIKCLKIPEEMSDQQRTAFLEKFREEAELLFRLSAALPEVVRPLHVDVLHLGEGTFVPFLALEWLDGESLDGIITKRREQGQAPLGLHKLLKMFRPIAAALIKAHHFPGPQGSVSIIHRDLKPENIFVKNLNGVETVKILDFGIATAKRAASAAAGRITGRMVPEEDLASFTPAYGAPEQWAPKAYGETGPWTDVWGLALTLCEAIVGSPPIDGDNYVMRRACLDAKRRPTPRTLGAEVSMEVDAVFERALAVDPKKRTKEIETFWTDLEVAMGLKPSLGRRDQRAEPGSSDTPPAPERHATGSGMRAVSAVGPPNEAQSRRRVAGPGSMDEDDLAFLGAAIVPIGPRPGGGARGGRPAEPSGDLEFDIPTRPASLPPPPPGPAEGSRQAREAGRPAIGAPPPMLTSTEAPPSPRGASPLGGNSAAAFAAKSRFAELPGDLEMDLEIDLETRREPPERRDSGHPSSLPPPPSLRAPAMPAAVAARPPLPREESPSPVPPAPAPTTPVPPAPAAKVVSAIVAPGSGRDPMGDEQPLELSLPMRLDASPPPSTGQRPFVVVDNPLSSRPAGTLAPRDGGTLAPRGPRRHEGSELRDRLRAPVGMLLASLAVALIEVGYNRSTQEHLMIGPIRPFWIAAPLALFGVAFTIWRLMGDHND